MKKFLIILLALALAFGLCPTVVLAESVTLEWSANSEPDLAGYRAFVRDWKGIYDYTKPAWEGTETTCTIETGTVKLPHFIVRAFDAEGLESGDSNEVYLSNGPPASPGNLTILQGN